MTRISIPSEFQLSTFSFSRASGWYVLLVMGGARPLALGEVYQRSNFALRVSYAIQSFVQYGLSNFAFSRRFTTKLRVGLRTSRVGLRTARLYTLDWGSIFG